MKIQLPPISSFRQFCRLENGWSDHYGAIQTAAAYVGMACPPRYFLRGVWQHGCFAPWHNVSAKALSYSAPGAQHLPVWVARPDQADLLARNGYTKPRVTGLPIVYTPEIRVTRWPGSLLVVPTHTLTGDKFPDRTVFDRYAAEIATVAGRFSKVVICIHPNCQRNGLWVDEFSRRGFQIVYGAQTNDANALLRMRMLFEQFEYVTTNGWGSHIPYALAFGAKVSVFGPQPKRTEADYLTDLCWAANPDGLRAMMANETVEQEQLFLKSFRRNPEEGVKDITRGRSLIGADHRLSPEEMQAGLADLTDLPVKPVANAGKREQRRILFVAHEATRTGAPMFLLHFLRWLRERTDLSFDLLLAKGGPLQEEFAKLAVVHEPKDFSANPELIRGYDLIYSNTVCNGSLLQELDCGSVPVITHVHELDLGYGWLGPRTMAGVIRQSSRFIACAGTVATRMQQIFNLPADRFNVHYEMIDASRVEANAAAADVAKLRAEYDLPENAFVVTGCGTFDLRKAPDLFVQVAARVKRTLGTDRPLRFLWIGAQNAPDLVNSVREDIRKLGITAEIRLVAEMPSPHGLIALSDLFCLPSREDPFPLVMLEAASLGKPVLCFEGAGGAGEFCAAGGGLSVPYLDMPAMADLACDLLRDPARRNEIGRRAAAVVRERFTVDVVAPALWQELQQHLQVQLPLPPERDHQVPLAEIYRKWNAACLPQPAVVAAHLARHDLRQRARVLVAEGRNREAIQLLIKAVGADLATKHAGIICEGLIEIAHELELLDPRQSAALVAKAREVAASTGLKLAQFQPPAVVRAAA